MDELNNKSLVKTFRDELDNFKICQQIDLSKVPDFVLEDIATDSVNKIHEWAVQIDYFVIGDQELRKIRGILIPVGNPGTKIESLDKRFESIW